jgi:hypothetical protein
MREREDENMRGKASDISGEKIREREREREDTVSGVRRCRGHRMMP